MHTLDLASSYVVGDTSTPLIEATIGQMLDLRPIADVAGDRQGRAAGFVLDLPCERFAGIELAAGDDDVSAGTGEGEHHLAAEPAAAAGDERRLATQVKEISRHARSVDAARRWRERQ